MKLSPFDVDLSVSVIFLWVGSVWRRFSALLENYMPTHTNTHYQEFCSVGVGLNLLLYSSIKVTHLAAFNLNENSLLPISSVFPGCAIRP